MAKTVSWLIGETLTLLRRRSSTEEGVVAGEVPGDGQTISDREPAILAILQNGEAASHRFSLEGFILRTDLDSLDGLNASQFGDEANQLGAGRWNFTVRGIEFLKEERLQ